MDMHRTKGLHCLGGKPPSRRCTGAHPHGGPSPHLSSAGGRPACGSTYTRATASTTHHHPRPSPPPGGRRTWRRWDRQTERHWGGIAHLLPHPSSATPVATTGRGRLPCNHTSTAHLYLPYCTTYCHILDVVADRLDGRKRLAEHGSAFRTPAPPTGQPTLHHMDG